MSDITADKLVKIYVKIRDERYALEKELENLKSKKKQLKAN